MDLHLPHLIGFAQAPGGEYGGATGLISGQFNFGWPSAEGLVSRVVSKVWTSAMDAFTLILCHASGRLQLTFVTNLLLVS